LGIFEREGQRLVVRVVYDGPGAAGKTTNLRQLCTFFTTRRRGELITPEEVDGRTLFFDWLDFQGGLVGGYSLRCQLLTVPGQDELAKRRRRILESADVVVFVCESSGAGIAAGRQMLRSLPPGLLTGPAPRVRVVVQANKQDQPGALSAPEVVAGLGLSSTTEAVAAIADRGAGVRETLALAVRRAADDLQRQLLERGIEGLSGTAQTDADLLAELKQTTRTIDRAALGKPVPTPTSARDPVPPDPASTGPLVWPAVRGRQVLQALVSLPPERRDDLVGRHGTSDGSGASDVIILQQGDWCLKTSRRRCFATVDDGRVALAQLARRKVGLGAWVHPDTVLCVAAADDGVCWLWTVTPWLTTLRAWMRSAARASNDDELAKALEVFADVVMASVKLAAQAGTVLDVHPANFAVAGDRIVYLDDDIVAGSSLPTVGHAIVRRIDEYAEHPAAVERYVSRLAAGLSELSPEIGRRLDLRNRIEAAQAQTELARRAQGRLAACLVEV
jgi:signal recognition particle receptor subunit beta